jgi:hypothetical protein
LMAWYVFCSHARDRLRFGEFVPVPWRDVLRNKISGRNCSPSIFKKKVCLVARIWEEEQCSDCVVFHFVCRWHWRSLSIARSACQLSSLASS